MFKWIQKLILRKAFKNAASSSAMDEVADETLKSAIQEMQMTSKTAQKMLQAKMIRQESKKTLEDIANLGDEEEDDEEEDDDGDLKIMDLVKLFNNSKGNQGVNPQDPYSETPTENSIKSKVDLLELVKTLSPEQKKLIKQKYGIAL